MDILFVFDTRVVVFNSFIRLQVLASVPLFSTESVCIEVACLFVNYQTYPGVDSEGFKGFRRTSPLPHLRLKISFSWKSWINFGYRIYPQYSHHTVYLILLFNKSILLPMNVCKIAG